MNDEMVEKAIAELRECWPYQQIPDLHLRHWRDVFRSFSRDVVRKVLHDCSITMTGRPSWGEFGHLCSQLSLVHARRAREGPYLDDEALEVNGPVTPPEEFDTEMAKLKAKAVRG
jgi:hypothetical protein